MKSSLKLYLILFVSLSCICGICSKDDAGNNNGNNTNYTEPVLNPADTWIYMTSGLPLYYPNNYTGNQIRPLDRKWIATKIVNSAALVLKSSIGDTTKGYLDFSFENTDKFTRFCADTLNPNGKEAVTISLKNFSRTPGPGTYTLDIDYKQGFCWYDVYKANGQLHDSTRHQAFDNSTLTIDKMVYVLSDPARNRYKMSGSAILWVMYFPSGASSTTDIYKMQCYFNNVQVDFLK